MTMWTKLLWFSLFVQCYTKPFNMSSPAYHHHSHFAGKRHKTPHHDVTGNKRSGAYYHKAVPEHFGMHEHGPEIHLDIDEQGSRVDTHPASLSVDTSTDPHEHAGHHHCECHHCCSTCCDCCDGYCCRRDQIGGRMNDDYEGAGRNPGAQLIQHTIGSNMMGNCQGGVCRDVVFQKSQHERMSPLHSFSSGLAQMEGFAPRRQSDPEIDNLKAGLQHMSSDGSVGHMTGLARQRIQNNGEIRNMPGSKSDEFRPKLLTFGGSDEGLAYTAQDVKHPYKSLASAPSDATITHTANVDDKTGDTRGFEDSMWDKYNAIANEGQPPYEGDDQRILYDRLGEGLAVGNTPEPPTLRDDLVHFNRIDAMSIRRSEVKQQGKSHRSK